MNFKKKSIIIHIGLSKTGSSSFQQSLKSQKFNNYLMLYKNDFTRNLIIFLDTEDKTKKEFLIKFLSQTKEDNIVISDEGIIGHPVNGFYNTNKRFRLLEDLFNKPKYIVFFRNPSSIVYSLYNFKLEQNNNLTFKKHINKNIRKLFKTPQSILKYTNYKIYNYNRICRNYIKIQDRVLFIQFEKFFKEKNLSKLHKFMGIDLKLDWEEKVNYSFKNLIYLEFYNKYIFFKLLKFFWIKGSKYFFFTNKKNFEKDRFLKPHQKRKKITSTQIEVLINFLIKFTPQKFLKKVDTDHLELIDEINNYHLKKYIDFKKKLNPKLNIFSLEY